MKRKLHITPQINSSIFKQVKFKYLKLVFLLFLLNSVSVQVVFGQTTGDFRSKNTTGNWSDSLSWQTYNGTAWDNATTYPGQNTGTYNVTIQSTHTISISSNFTAAGYPTVNMGSVVVNGTLSIGGSELIQIYLTTPLLSIASTGVLNFVNQKTELYLSSNAVLQINSGGTITGKTSNNSEIYIDNQLVAVGAGGGGSVVTFSTLVAGGGSLNSNITTPSTSPTTISLGQPITLIGKFDGALTSINYQWSALDPDNFSVSITSNSGTLANNTSVTTPTSFTPTKTGTYLVSLRVANAGNTLVNIETKTVIVVSSLDIPVINGDDDVEENVIGGAMDLSSTDLELYKDGSDEQFVGIRFQNVSIPASSTITKAYIQFKVDETNPTAVTLNVKGINVDNSSIFTNDAYNISKRIDGTLSSSTLANVSWTPPSWPAEGDQGIDQRTSELKTIVQEIINRNGWNSGNAMSFVFSKVSGAGVRIAESYNGDSSGAPTLHIEYTQPVRAIKIVDDASNFIADASANSPSVVNNTQFGNVQLGLSSTKTYTIKNNGTSVLTISSITSSLGEFTLSGVPTTVAAGSSATFNVIFTPSNDFSTFNSTITVNNNDPDIAEQAYTFTVQGTGQPLAPEINLKGNSFNIASGDISPYAGDNTYFYSSAIATAETHAFTIENTGSAVLNITSITSNNAEFTITGVPVSISALGTGTFNVVYSPTNAGPSVATITILNNDGDEFSYTFNVAGEISTPQTVGPNGAWKYLDNGSDQGTAWQGTGYDDSSWASGNAELGFGDGDETTVVSYGGDANNIYTTTYFRKTFIATAADLEFDILALKAIRDDGMVVYLNGTEIWRDNMPTGTISYSTFASAAVSNESSWTSKNFINSLVVGTNVLAVEIHQNSLTSSDLSFNFDLELEKSSILEAGGVWYYKDDGSNQGTAWQTDTGLYSTWSKGFAQLGFGDSDETTVINDVDQITTYFRKSFEVSATEAAFKNLVLNAIIDDGMVVYIDGVEVWRDNMPTGAIVFSTVATTDTPNEDDWKNIILTNNLTVGTHEIAVEVHQNSSTSSDVSFDFYIEFNNLVLTPDEEWYYLDDGSNQGTAWRTANVGPSGANWSSGNAQLGFGDGDETTVLVNNSQITTYFRKTITATGVDVTNSTLQINAVRDDGIVVYINGVEVLRNNMPTGPINYNTTAFGDVTNLATDRNFEDFWNVYKVDNSLINGVNEIAVEIHQYNASSNDISFNLSLETNNDFILVPTIKPDRDLDGVEDYLDADDDNDALPDVVEGCFTTKPEILETDGDGETQILNKLPLTTTPLDDGNSITYSVNDKTKFTEINAYDAGQHGFGLRVRGPVTEGEFKLEFAIPVNNLFFKLIDFDEGEKYKIDVYDAAGVIVDLETEEGIYHLGSYINFNGDNTIEDIYNTTAPNANNPENRADDIYGAAYFYFPNIKVSKIVFTIDYTGGGTIRIAGVQYCSLDTDGDGIDDFYDSDSDNDGIPDIVEGGGTDENGDGKVDNFIDIDGDGVSEPYDSDPNTYFISEAGKLLALDFDYDGIINRIDLDSDNDGILDIIEAGGIDVNGDGQIDGFTDVDKDGYHDPFDGAGSLLITGPDANGDGFPDNYPYKNADETLYPNFRDIDSDDDGITDHTEAQATLATFINYTGVDSDGDGILDVYDNYIGFGGNGLIPVDSDGDGTPDYLDLNSDNHGELDIIEGHDSNGDGFINPSDEGSCLTSITAFTGLKTGLDEDEDGLDDGFDNNISQTASNYNPTNEGFSPMLLPNIDDIATPERDWREPDQVYSFIDFDGFNDYIDFADKHNLTSSFTIEAWVKQNSSSNGNGFIVGKRDCNKGTNAGYNFGLVNNYPNIKWYNTSGGLIVDLTATYAIGKDKWYYVSATYNDVTKVVKLYIDGVEVASASSISSAPLATTESFLLGAKFDDTDLSQKLSNEFHGWIDEVRIWNVALNEEQMHMMMNQEIEENGTFVKGKTIPIDVPGLAWANLLGYYPMNSIVIGDLVDQSSYANNGRIRNILTAEEQTAPLPYTTAINGNWDTNTTWTQNSVWNIPNTVGVDGSTIVDWNIVTTSHDVNTVRAVNVLGLKVNANELSINADNRLDVTHYLKIDGVIDLDGESQLIQPEGSYFDPASSGYIERDQQGEGNKYRYNQWSSPVYTANDGKNYTTVAASLRDGTDPDNPKTITFNDTGYDGETSS
uniref:choice-of-anchor D domain-containing protein n=1 Tax=Lutibacter sp. TaxID=1925666 RepID=UPI00356B6063